MYKNLGGPNRFLQVNRAIKFLADKDQGYHHSGNILDEEIGENPEFMNFSYPDDDNFISISEKIINEGEISKNQQE